MSVTSHKKPFAPAVELLHFNSVRKCPGHTFFAAGCTISDGVYPERAPFFNYLSLLYIRRFHEEISGCTVLADMHPVSAENISLILDTEVFVYIVRRSS